MSKIEELDQEISKHFNILKEVVKEIDFIEQAQFNLKNVQTAIPWTEISFPGIYLIEIKNSQKFTSFSEWVENFRLEWEDEKYLKKFTPNLKNIRIKAHSELQDWIPLYIGKSRNIKSRIHGHIFKELHKTTFALKLLSREHLQEDTFRLSTIRVDVQNYDAIVPKIEWQLRKKINPLIGKQ